MPWPKTDVIPYYTQLGLPEKGRVIKEFIV